MSIRDTTLTKAIRMLDAVGAKYAILYNGASYGTLPIETPQPVAVRPKYKRGTTRAHYLPYLENLQPGDSAEVPFDRFDGTVMAANVSAYCTHKWGSGCSVTSRNDETRSVEVLRIA